MKRNYDWQTRMYSVKLQHDGLQKFKLIRDRDPQVLEKKAYAQQALWEKQWSKQRLKEEQQRLKKSEQQTQQQAKAAEQKKRKSKLDQAERRTKIAKSTLECLKNLLLEGIKRNPTPDFGKLKKREQYEMQEFSKPRPELQKSIEKQELLAEPIRPSEDAPKYQPHFKFIDQLVHSRKERIIATAKALFEADLKIWEQKKAEIEQLNNKRKLLVESRSATMQAAYERRLSVWEKEKEAFEIEQKNTAEEFRKRQKEENDEIKNFEKAYSKKTEKGIVEYCRSVLSSSDYPQNFPRKYEIEYIAETKILLVEYCLPAIEVIPTVVEVKYLPARDEFKEVLLPDSAKKRIYDDLLYQIVLRCLYELFKADRVKTLGSIVINGWVRDCNKATGKKVNTCILSVHTTRDAFLGLDLKKVEPKACFKLLKGVGSSELHGLAAIAPIMRIDKKDKRFVDAYSVAGELDSAVNLAAMDWEDFEHLVRELFEKEFAQFGGEVKITQASRDGGVDAVAFDPDPIRGGKIVIQAKRYTNVVGLSAVRDLYGTVMNEGATKGILVTTATYGPDAYEFAKDKPLTLFNGSNLLHMLERHGHKAKIDIQEAKLVLAKKTKR